MRSSQAGLMTIGQLARKSAVTPRAIRYYEQIRLIGTPSRSESNYRLFDSDSMERLRFISKCRSLGFSITEIASLIRVTDNPDHTCAQIQELTECHVNLIDGKIQNLMEMRATLSETLSRCTGREAPECAVLDFLRNSA